MFHIAGAIKRPPLWLITCPFSPYLNSELGPHLGRSRTQKGFYMIPVVPKVLAADRQGGHYRVAVRKALAKCRGSFGTIILEKKAPIELIGRIEKYRKAGNPDLCSLSAGS
jgi:hypothetical protein